LLRSQATAAYSFDGTPGRTYCFKVKAIDAAGNAAWSNERCQVTPLDDSSGYNSGWSRSTGSSFYNGTVSVARSRGVRLSFPSLRAKYLSVGVQMCSSCRYLEVFWNGKLLKRMYLYSSTAKWAHVPLASFGSVTSGKLELVATAPVDVVDFVGVSQV
jgi:hypothetical protein